VGVKFFAHVQTGSGAHLASCSMGTGSFLGVKRPGRGADHPPLPSAEVENELYLYSHSGPLVACDRVNFKLTSQKLAYILPVSGAWDKPS
jgi:hypothetical protein